MTQIDEAIRRALTAEDARALDAFAADEGLLALVLATFGGPFRWLNLAGWIAGFAVFGVGLWGGLRFVRAGDLREMMLWGALVGLAAATLVMIKLWFWMELHRNATQREIKRLELQVARLAARLPG